MFKQKRWDLKELLPDFKGKEFKHFLNDLLKKVEIFENLRKDLKPDISSEKFLEIWKFDEKISEMCAKIGGFVELKYSEDVSNTDIVAFKTKMENLLTNVSNRMLFFNLFWKKLDNNNASRLIKGAGIYADFLKFERKFIPYTLLEKEEQIINLKDSSGVNTLVNLYTLITSKFNFNFKGKKLSRDELGIFVRDPSSKIRSDAYNILLNKFIESKDILGEIYKSIVLNWKNENLILRKYKSEISPRNLSNDIPDEVIETIFSVCKDNNSIFQDYFRLKAKLIGVKKLRRYDLYAPISKFNEKIKFEKAVNLVFDNFKQLDQEFYKRAFEIFNRKHVDSEIRKNKRASAYCFGATPNVRPYIFINFANTYQDLLTLAHETGHGVHFSFSSKNPISLYEPGLPLAETASTFSETMMYEKLSSFEDLKLKNFSFFSQLDNYFATISRQIYFGMFEKEVHKNILTLHGIEDIAKIYSNNLKNLFGNSVSVSPDFSWEWLYVPHFFETPFYTYAYSFGNLLSIALYQRYKKEGKDFILNYKNILSSGGSKEPAKLLKENGFDISSRQFWQQGFDFIKEKVKEARKLYI